MAARNQSIPDIPILITPHPVNDLTSDQLREMAMAALPVVIEQLTRKGALPQNQPIDFVHPAVRANLHCIHPDSRGAET
jgi:hypothetical protein